MWLYATVTSSMPFEVVVRVVDDRAELLVWGELDSATAPILEASISPAVDDHRFVVVDLAAVSFIDSTGIATLIGATKRARAREGDVYLRAVRPNVQRALAHMAVDHLFEILPPDG